MKLSSAIALVVLLLAAGFYVHLRSRKVVKPQFKTTDELVQWLANEAVKDAREQNHVDLDYSIQSIQNVEAVLGRVHDQYAKNPSSISANGLASAYGAYIGEVIRRTEPGAK
jgi:hypothetical protein